MKKLGSKKVLKDLKFIGNYVNISKDFFKKFELMLENDSTKEDIKNLYQEFKNKVGVK